MKLGDILRCGLVLIFAAQLAAAATWTGIKDKQGRYLKVKFKDVNGSQIEVIRKRDGRKFKIDFSILSETSQQEVIKWAKDNIASEIESELRGGRKVKRDLLSDDDLPQAYYPLSRKEIKEGLAEIERRPNPGFDQDRWKAVTLLNQYRFLSGVDAEVELDKKLNAKAQAAAEICAKKGRLSHDFGHFTDRCNLAMGGGGAAASVTQYINDAGGNNRARRGHRRWCLFPELDETGFGVSGQFGAMHCFQHGGKDNRDSVTYPGKGLYPLDFLHGNAWSVYLTGKAPKKDDLEIEIYKLAERPVRRIGMRDAVDGKSIGVQYVSTYQDTINFEPAELIDSQGIYYVRITGGGVREAWITELY